jgi:hypothetical protein
MSIHYKVFSTGYTIGYNYVEVSLNVLLIEEKTITLIEQNVYYLNQTNNFQLKLYRSYVISLILI